MANATNPDIDTAHLGYDDLTEAPGFEGAAADWSVRRAKGLAVAFEGEEGTVLEDSVVVGPVCVLG